MFTKNPLLNFFSGVKKFTHWLCNSDVPLNNKFAFQFYQLKLILSWTTHLLAFEFPFSFEYKKHVLRFQWTLWLAGLKWAVGWWALYTFPTVNTVLITSYSSIDNRSSHRVLAPINSAHSSNNTSNYRTINKQSTFSKPFYPVSNKTVNSSLMNQPGKPGKFGSRVSKEREYETKAMCCVKCLKLSKVAPGSRALTICGENPEISGWI